MGKDPQEGWTAEEEVALVGRSRVPQQAQGGGQMPADVAGGQV